MPSKSSIAIFIAATSALAISSPVNAGDQDLGGLKEWNTDMSIDADFILDDYEERKKDLKNFCEQNKLNDFSLNEEMLLCFIQFPYSTTDYLKSVE